MLVIPRNSRVKKTHNDFLHFEFLFLVNNHDFRPIEFPAK